jgi:hypothetical protein
MASPVFDLSRSSPEPFSAADVVVQTECKPGNKVSRVGPPRHVAADPGGLDPLTTVCPLCHQELKPAEWMRVDGERIRCAKCRGVFIEQRSSKRMT